MKLFAFISLLLILVSCQQKPRRYTSVILDNDSIYTTNIHKIDEAEKALICGYLFAYGNECTTDSDKNKCNLLTDLQIDNECDSTHRAFLKKWFKKDGIMQYKLQKCPNLPHNFAIQNSFDKLVLKRKNDTLSIHYIIKGMNNSQEKSWNINREETYLIKNNTLLKID